MKTRTKEIIFFVAWFVAYILSVNFFRFKFGLFQISGAFLVLGGLLQWLLFHRKADRPKQDSTAASKAGGTKSGPS